MSDYGVLSTGFVRPTLQEILDERRETVRSLFGNVNLGPESVFGQLLGLEAEREDRLWQLAEAVYLSQYPNSAAGRSLSEAVQLMGITRLPATRSTVSAALFGNEGAVLLAGVQAANAEGDTFALLEETEITRESAVEIQLTLTLTDAATWQLNYDASNVTHTIVAANGLAAETATFAGVIDAVTGLDATVVSDGVIRVVSTDRNTLWNFSVTGPLTISNRATLAQMRSVETGPITAPEGTLETIVTPQTGWTAVTNYVDASPGREVETDVALRQRRLQLLQVGGAGTVEAIRARLLAVQDVTSALVVSNRETTTDGDGRPPKSFEATVSGGTDLDVATAIWLSKPAGIETHGNTSQVITDSQGIEHTMNFSRPVPVYVWAEIVITTNGEWDGDTAPAIIKAAVEAYGDTLSIGDDVKWQALFGAVYAAPGVASATIEIADSSDPGTEPDGVDFDSANITIAATEVALFDADRVTVTEAA